MSLLMLPLSTTTLTPAEAAGVIAGRLGLVPERRRSVPRDWPSAISRFLAPPAGAAPTSNRPVRPTPSLNAAFTGRTRRPGPRDDRPTLPCPG